MKIEDICITFGYTFRILCCTHVYSRCVLYYKTLCFHRHTAYYFVFRETCIQVPRASNEYHLSITNLIFSHAHMILCANTLHWHSTTITRRKILKKKSFSWREFYCDLTNVSYCKCTNKKKTVFLFQLGFIYFSNEQRNVAIIKWVFSFYNHDSL